MRKAYWALTLGVLLLASANIAIAQRQKPSPASPQTPARACPNLSGTYGLSSDIGSAYFTVKQTRCERIDVLWVINQGDDGGHSAHTLTLDGQLHPDVWWFGEGYEQRSAARFRGNTL